MKCEKMIINEEDEEKMVIIEINVEINGVRYETTQKIEEGTYNEILKICNERKCNITDLLINNITEMTPEEAEEIVCSWDM